MDEIWEPVGETLKPGMQLAAVLDTAEGFRLLVQGSADPMMAYAISGHVIYYSKWNTDLLLHDIPSYEFYEKLKNSPSLIFEVKNSKFIQKHFHDTDGQHDGTDVFHYVLLFPYELRIDLVTAGRVVIRWARDHSD